jgi:predicted ribosome quality control (RQC) complex YloA/Tae2 family protein
MKRQISSIDLHFLVEDMQRLKDSRIDKIYHPEENLIVISLFKTNFGKAMLNLRVGQSAFVSDEKEEYKDTLGFGMVLRKHLDGFFLSEIAQVEPERIMKINLYIEFFGKGNVIICDRYGVIINALSHHDFRERSVKPKLKYVYPVMKYNLFSLKMPCLIDMLKSSKKESVVVSLATELGLGGTYSEEVCMVSGVEKTSAPKDIDENKATSILCAINGITGAKADPYLVLDEKKAAIDFVPFELVIYESNEKKKLESFSQAILEFYSQFKEEKESDHDKKMKSLQRIILLQQAAIEELRKEENELRQKGEMIYHNYNPVKEILDELNKASKKHSWKEIKERLRSHEVIKEVNEKDRKVVVEI